MDPIKQLMHLPIFVGAADNCENFLAEFSRHPRHAGRRLSLERLPVQTSLPCDHDVGIFHFCFEPDFFCDNIESGPDFCAAKTQQAEAESARRAGAGFIAIIASKFFGHDIGQPG